MADIDKITASNGTTYNIKDSTARDSISQRLPFFSISTTAAIVTFDAAGMAALENLMPQKTNCAFRLSRGSLYLGFYLFASNDYAAYLFFSYGGLYIAKKTNGAWADPVEIS